MKYDIPYEAWLPFHSFYLGVSLGLVVFSIEKNLYPLLALSILCIMTCTSYLSILFWEEAKK
jgi:hypothetical protein